MCTFILHVWRVGEKFSPVSNLKGLKSRETIVFPQSRAEQLGASSAASCPVTFIRNFTDSNTTKFPFWGLLRCFKHAAVNYTYLFYS